MKRYDRHGLYNTVQEKWYSMGDRAWKNEIVTVGRGDFMDCFDQYRHIYNTQRISLYEHGKRCDDSALKSLIINLWVVHIDCFNDIAGLYYVPDFSQSISLEKFVGSS